MKTTVFLIRHGEISNPNKIIYGSNIDLKLSEEGKKQIKDLAKKILNLGYKIDKIYSSPSLRTKETSNILARALYIKDVLMEPDFRDDDMQKLAGKPLNLLSQFSPDGIDQYSRAYLKYGAESKRNVIKRVMRAFSAILKKEEGRTIMIVSHGNPISFLIFYLLTGSKKLPTKDQIKKYLYHKGSAIKLVLDRGKVLDKQYIS